MAAWPHELCWARVYVRVSDFEWDETKASANLRKHGVSFEEAMTHVWDIADLVALMPKQVRAPWGSMKRVVVVDSLA